MQQGESMSKNNSSNSTTKNSGRNHKNNKNNRNNNSKNNYNSYNKNRKTGNIEKKSNNRKKISLFKRFILIVIFLAILGGAGYYAYKNILPKYVLQKLENPKTPDWIDVQIIPLDGVSRDGSKLDGFNDVVVHYVGNPGTTAQQNHDFYCNPESEVSSHFIVGLDGEIIQCIPLDEQSAASNWRNHDTISIEVCHPDETGIFNKETYMSLVRLVAWLTDYGYLSNKHIIRHYDVTGKECPMYYVKHPDAWAKFKEDVKASR